MAIGDITVKFKTATGAGTKTVQTSKGTVTTAFKGSSGSSGGSSGGSSKTPEQLENERLTNELNKTLNQFATASSNTGLPTEQERKDFVKNVSNIYGVSQGDVYNAINPALNKISEGKKPGDVVSPTVVRTTSGYSFTPGSTGAGSSTLTVSGNTRTISQDGSFLYGERDIETRKNFDTNLKTNDSNSSKMFGGQTQIIEKNLPQTQILNAPGSPEDQAQIVREKGTYKEYVRKIKNVPGQVSTFFTGTFEKGRDNINSGNSYNILTGAVQNTGAGLVIAGYVGAKTFIDIVNPVENVKGVYTLITDPKGTFNALEEGAENLGSGLMSGKPESLGTLGGIVAGARFGPKVESLLITSSAKVLGKGTKLIKDTYTELTVKQIPAETLVPKDQVLTGRGFSTTSSSKQFIKDFENVNFEATHLTDSKLPFDSSGRLNVIEGRRGSKGLEDPGTYLGVKGQGSAEFLRINRDLIKYEGEPQISLNPLPSIKQFSDVFREARRTPEILLIQTKGIKEVPKNILLEPGFGASAKFSQENLAGTGYVRLTKRGQIGKGELPSQIYEAPVSFTKAETGGITALSPTKGKITEVTKGELLKEMGTIEGENLLDVGNTLLDRGIEGTTKIAGKTVYVRRADIEIKKNIDTLTFSKLDNAKNLEPKKGYDISSSLKSQVTKRPTSSPLSYGSLSSVSSKVSSGSLSSSTLRSGSSSGLSSFGKSSGSSLSGISKGVSSGISSISIPTSSISGGSSIVSSGVSSRRGGVSSGLSTPGPTRGSIFNNPPAKKPVSPYKKRQEEKQDNNAYDVVYRERGKVVKLNSQPLPINKAFNLAQNKVDNTTARSLEVRKSGVTNLKDDPKKNNTYKYRIRKTKQALILVEKEKYAIDTRGEKRGLKLSKGGF